MEAFEVPMMVAALVLMFGAVGAKILTTARIAQLNTRINHVEQDKQEALGRLKGVQNQTAVLQQNMRVMETKKAKLSKKYARLQKEESQFHNEEATRKQRTGMRKVN